jgi:hypothetical protein
MAREPTLHRPPGAETAPLGPAGGRGHGAVSGPTAAVSWDASPSPSGTESRGYETGPQAMALPSGPALRSSPTVPGPGSASPPSKPMRRPAPVEKAAPVSPSVEAGRATTGESAPPEPTPRNDEVLGRRIGHLELLVRKLLGRVKEVTATVEELSTREPSLVRPAQTGPRRRRTAGAIVRALTVRLTEDVDTVVRAEAVRLGWTNGRVVNELLRRAVQANLQEELDDAP